MPFDSLHRTGRNVLRLCCGLNMWVDREQQIAIAKWVREFFFFSFPSQTLRITPLTQNIILASGFWSTEPNAGVETVPAALFLPLWISSWWTTECISKILGQGPIYWSDTSDLYSVCLAHIQTFFHEVKACAAGYFVIQNYVFFKHTIIVHIHTYCLSR